MSLTCHLVIFRKNYVFKKLSLAIFKIIVKFLIVPNNFEVKLLLSCMQTNLKIKRKCTFDLIMHSTFSLKIHIDLEYSTELEHRKLSEFQTSYRKKPYISLRMRLRMHQLYFESSIVHLKI